MKQSGRVDIVCIDKILKYIWIIRNAYETFNIGNAKDLEEHDLCQLAVTQAVTNIYELYKKMREDTLSKAPSFSKIRLGLKAARNIASHEYGSLDFGIIYRLTNQLLNQTIIDELEAIRNDLKQNSTGDSQS